MKTLSAWATTIIGAVLSLYLVWGWVTTTDLKQYCRSANLDYNEVAAAMLASDMSSLETVGEGTNKTYKITLRDTLPIERLSVGLTFIRSHGAAGTNEVESGLSYFDGGMIEPFLLLSDNFVNAVYCFALGFLISFVILLAKVLKRDDIRAKVVALRPILGGACAACIFLLVLSCGNLVLENSGPVRSSALGLIGMMGAIMCERFERLLKEAVPKRFDEIGG